MRVPALGGLLVCDVKTRKGIKRLITRHGASMLMILVKQVSSIFWTLENYDAVIDLKSLREVKGEVSESRRPSKWSCFSGSSVECGFSADDQILVEEN